MRLQEFSTATVPPMQRIARWTEFGSETLSEMIVVPADRASFQARLQRVEVGELGLAFLRSTPASVESPATRAGAWASPERDALVMTFVEAGSSTLSQDRWSVELGAGDVVLRDLGRPWRTQLHETTSLILVKLPFSLVLRKLPNPDRILGRRLSGRLPAVAFAGAVVRASRDSLLSEACGEWQDLIADVLADVFRLVYDGACEEAPAGGPQVARRVSREAVRYILEHLDDPELTVRQVADNVGVSLRQLQRVFVEHGETPRQFILNQRLKTAAEAIAASTHCGDKRIIDIALSAGFNDLSHFTRSFSARYGCSPTRYRLRRAGRA